jgi:hypothetical protein
MSWSTPAFAVGGELGGVTGVVGSSLPPPQAESVITPARSIETLCCFNKSINSFVMPITALIIPLYAEHEHKRSV